MAANKHHSTFLYPCREDPLEPAMRKVLEAAGWTVTLSQPGLWLAEASRTWDAYFAARVAAIGLEEGIVVEVKVEQRLTVPGVLFGLLLLASVVGMLVIVVASIVDGARLEERRLGLYHRL